MSHGVATTEVISLMRPSKSGRLPQESRSTLAEHPPRNSDSWKDWIKPHHCTGTFIWVSMANGQVPYGAVIGGGDHDGSPLYVGRAYYNGDILPCKIKPSHGCAYVPYNGHEIRVNNYDVLVSKHVAWRSDHGGHIPHEAIKIGQTSSGESLYSGRTLHQGTLTPGKVHPTHRCLYISYDGKELRYENYEILVLY